MTLYEIDQELIDIFETHIDPETGEVQEGFDIESELNKLQMRLDNKIENIACYIKNLNAEAEALKEEKLKLAQRQKIKENKANRLKKYLDEYLKHTQDITKYKFETPRCLISYRSSTSVKIDDINKIPEIFIKPRKLEEKDVDKTEIKDYLKHHKEETISGVRLEKNRNIQIK